MPLYELIYVKKYIKKGKDGSEDKEETLFCQVGKVFINPQSMNDTNQKKVGQGHLNINPNEELLVLKPRLYKSTPSVDF